MMPVYFLKCLSSLITMCDLYLHVISQNPFVSLMDIGHIFIYVDNYLVAVCINFSI
jgi:hypothetical protein